MPRSDDDNMFKKIQMGTQYMNVVRFLCAYLLHLQTIPEIQQGKEMMSYAKKNASEFVNKEWFYPFLVGMFKCAGGVFACFTNTLIILQSADDDTSVPDIVEAVKDFIAVGIIYEIDNIMAKTLFDSPSKDLIDENTVITISSEADKRTDWKVLEKFKPDENDDDPERLNTREFLLLVVAMFGYRLFSVFYQVFYFYFIPICVVLIYM